MWRTIRRLCFMLIAWVGLFGVSFGLRLFGYRRLIRVLAKASPTPWRQGYTPRARMAARLIERVSNWWPKPPASCLQRSVLLWWHLRCMGIASVIRTGIRRDAVGGLDLHAWVEQGDIVINDRLDTIAKYTPLWSVLSPDTIIEHKLR